MFSKVIFFIWGKREKQISKEKNSLKIIRGTILAGTMNLRTTTTRMDKMSRNQCLHQKSDTSG